MTHSIWESIANIPWWSYLIIVYIFNLGLAATRPHITNLHRLIIFPALVLSFSIIFFIAVRQSYSIDVSYWVWSALAGIALGWLHFRWLNIKFIKEESKLFIPGSWSIMTVIILSALSQIYISYQAHFHPQTNVLNLSRLFIMYGLIVGLFAGRLIYSLQCMKKGPFLIPNPQLQNGSNP